MFYHEEPVEAGTLDTSGIFSRHEISPSDTHSGSIVSCRGNVYYGVVKALEIASFEVKSGEIIALIGPPTVRGNPPH